MYEIDGDLKICLNKERTRFYEISVGDTYKVRDFILNELLLNELLNKRFKIVPKRLNRWWYSIYIDKL